MHRIGFIGSGKMAFALIKSIEKNVISILASDKHRDRLDYIKKNTNAEITEENKVVVENSDIVFLCVKPNQMKDVLKEIKPFIKEQIIISIAAGITIQDIEKILGKKRIIRVMPNTPSLVGEMAAGYSVNKTVDEQDLNIVDGLLNSMGIAILMEEDKINAVTGVSGSSPAFFAKITKYIVENCVAEGLEESVALKLAAQTLVGTGKMLLEMTPDELIEMVSSPNGSTLAGLEVLDKEKIHLVIKKTIKATLKRNKELGKE